MVAKVEAAEARNESAKGVKPVGIPKCWMPVVIFNWERQSKDKAS